MSTLKQLGIFATTVTAITACLGVAWAALDATGYRVTLKYELEVPYEDIRENLIDEIIGLRAIIAEAQRNGRPAPKATTQRFLALCDRLSKINSFLGKDAAQICELPH